MRRNRRVQRAGRFSEHAAKVLLGGHDGALAFSIATTIEPEILLVDEVLSTGDLAFQRKARSRIEQLLGHARMVVMVSHDLGSIENFCDRVVWLDHGRMRAVGPAPR